MGEVFLWRGRENEKSERRGKGVFIMSSKAKIADRGKKITPETVTTKGWEWK